MNMPKVIDLGFGDVVEVSYLEELFGISRRTALKYLQALRLEPLYVGKDVYFCLNSFKRIMFVLSKPNSPGFVFPGSNKKKDARYKKSPTSITEVTDEILAEAAKPEILSEMAGAEGKNPNILKQYIARPVGRPPKEKD